MLGRLVRERNWDKRRAHVGYWRRRARIEGDLRANNRHYEAFFTDFFGFTLDDYAGKRILDIGCGPRGSLEWAANARERVGLDPLVPEYRDLGIDEHDMSYVEGRAEDIPFPDAHFDVISSLNTLDHVDDIDAAISEITRVAAPGGMFLLLVEVNHPPTKKEPLMLEWNVTDRFAGWEIVSERRTGMRAPNQIYSSFADGHPRDPKLPGVVGAALRRSASRPREGQSKRRPT